VTDVVPGDDETAARFAVEPVNYSRTFDAAEDRQLGVMMEQGMHEGAGPVPGAGMDDETWVLVQHEEVRILVEDADRDGLRLEGRGLGFRHVHDYLIPEVGEILLPDCPFVHGYATVADELLQA
jgi:hypothetical protein